MRDIDFRIRLIHIHLILTGKNNRVNPPFFIIGNPRSGTTLFRLIMDSHPDLVVPPECGFLVWWYKKYKDWTLDSLSSDSQMRRLLHDFENSRKMETWGMDFGKLRSYIERIAPENYGELSACLYEFYSLKSNGKVLRWGDKNNFYIHEIATLNAIYPNALYLLITRDGRDVACSYRELNRRKIQSRYAPDLPDDIVDIASEWLSNNQHAIRTLKDNGKPYHWDRNEDLVLNPEDTIRSCCRFLDVEFSPVQLDFFQARSSEEPEEFLQWKEKVRNPIQASSVGRFKKELTEEQIGVLQRYAGRMLQELGYKLH